MIKKVESLLAYILKDKAFTFNWKTESNGTIKNHPKIIDYIDEENEPKDKKKLFEWYNKIFKRVKCRTIGEIQPKIERKRSK